MIAAGVEEDGISRAAETQLLEVEGATEVGILVDAEKEEAVLAVSTSDITELGTAPTEKDAAAIAVQGGETNGLKA